MNSVNKTTPAESVDSTAVQLWLSNIRGASDPAPHIAGLIAHIDADKARAVAAARIDAIRDYAALLEDNNRLALQAAAPQQHAQAALSIGAHKPFELATKALHQDWTPEKVHHLIDVVDQFIAASHQPAAAQPAHNKHCGCPNCCEVQPAPASKVALDDPWVAAMRHADNLCPHELSTPDKWRWKANCMRELLQPEVKP